MDTTFTPVTGVTSAEPKVTDFTIGGDNVSIEIMNTPIQDTTISETNQNRERRYYYTCVPHATMGCIADLFNLSLNEYHSLIEKGVQRALDTGKLDINSGMAVSDMVDIARTIWNQENPDKKVMSFRIPYADPNLKLALERGHSLVTAYRGGPSWNADFNVEGVLGKTRYSPITYGHSVRLRNGDTIIDNYIGVQKFNRYSVSFMKNLVGHHFWDCFYVFLPVDKIPELTLARLFAFRSGIWNGKDENAPITFEQLATMVGRASKIKNNVPMYPQGISYVSDLQQKGISIPANREDLVKREKMGEIITKMLGSAKWSGKFPKRNATRGEVAEVIHNTLVG